MIHLFHVVAAVLWVAPKIKSCVSSRRSTRARLRQLAVDGLVFDTGSEICALLR